MSDQIMKTLLQSDEMELSAPLESDSLPVPSFGGKKRKSGFESPSGQLSEDDGMFANQEDNIFKPDDFAATRRTNN